MRLLRRLHVWWRWFWGPDFGCLSVTDTHRWENKSEIMRRLSG
jgi:hypothetical protein